MLSRYDGKTIRLTTTDGEVFVGEAESFSSGYGLDTFGTQEEGLCIDDTCIFLSQIARIEPPEGFAITEDERRQYDKMTQALLEMPYRTADCLPIPLPQDAGGQPFMVGRYFRLPAQLSVLRRKQARILLRLNCFSDMAVTTDGGETYEKNPDPEQLVRTLDALSGDRFLRALFPRLNVMIEASSGDTRLTVVCPDAEAAELIRKLTEAEGLFLGGEQPCI